MPSNTGLGFPIGMRCFTFSRQINKPRLCRLTNIIKHSFEKPLLQSLRNNPTLKTNLTPNALSAFHRTEHLFNVNETQGFFLGYLGIRVQHDNSLVFKHGSFQMGHLANLSRTDEETCDRAACWRLWFLTFSHSMVPLTVIIIAVALLIWSR